MLLNKPDTQTHSTEDKMVSVGAVMKGGAIIVGSLSSFALLATLLSGVILIQPLLAIDLMIISLGFGLMGIARPSQRGNLNEKNTD